MDQLKTLFLALASSPGREDFLVQFLEELVFPWYQVKTGKYTTVKDMRQAVCQKLEVALTKVVWIDGDVDEENEGDTPEYYIGRVFPKSVGGDYEVMVTLSCSTSDGEVAVITLTDLLIAYKPIGILQFSHYDA